MKDHGMRHLALMAIAVGLAVGCVNLERPPELSVAAGPDGATPDAAAPIDVPDAAAPVDGAAADAAAPAADVAPSPKGADAMPDAAAEADASVQLRGNGEACSAPAQCQSRFCVDGVCCVTACAGDCHACNVAEMEGRCVPAAEGTDPRGLCPREEPATCRHDGACDGRGACRMHSASTECAPGACVGATESAARFCDGAGTCRAPASNRSCSPNVCNGSSCGTRCSSNGECQMGFSCNAGACVASAGRPVLHWSFDEPDGTTANDQSGNGFHGVYGGPTSIPAPSTEVPTVQFPDPRSRAFVANSRHMVRLAPLPGALKVATGATVSAWFRTTRISDTDGYSEIASVGDGYIIIMSRTHLGFMKRVAGPAYDWCPMATSRHLDGRWHHVAGVVSATSLKTYLDGVEGCSKNTSAPLTYSNTPELVVGRDPDPRYGYYFDGAIDDVRIYTRVLPFSEISALAAGAN
jgi:hypothetical protein